MFEAQSDVPFVWIAVLLASAAVAGVVLGMPTAPPPDADRVAMAIDEVASSDHAAAASVPLDAERVRIGRDRIGLETDGGRAHATIAFGPVVPARTEPLRRVLHGTPPAAVFASEEDFRRAIDAAQRERTAWVAAPETLYVRRVSYGEVNRVIVGR